jgi:mono/diheme cytochrome c family protein
MTIKTALSILTIAAASTLFAASAQAQAPATYTSKCQMCHGATGLGDTPAGKAMGATSFKSPAAEKATDTEIATIIKSGKGKMPAFTGKLSDPEITALVVYIRKLQK